MNLFRKLVFLLFSENVSDTFIYSLPLYTFNDYVHLSLPIVIYAGLLPLILEITFLSFFKIFNSFFFFFFFFFFVVTWS